MSNHEHRCRGCGNDLRRESGNHEGNCLASKLDAARKYCEEVIGRDMAGDDWRWIGERIQTVVQCAP